MQVTCSLMARWAPTRGSLLAGCRQHRQRPSSTWTCAAPQAPPQQQQCWQRPNVRAYSTPVPSNGSSLSSANGWLEDGAVSSVRRDYDAIMVLGGGLTPDGGLPEWVHRRLEGALYIYRQQQQQQQQEGTGTACPIVLLGSGTPHKPPVIDKAGFVLHESTAYAKYLIEQGVSAERLLKEMCSYDTVGNGYFSLVIHALPAGWRNIAIVTSDFHMPRTRAIFDYIYALAGEEVHGDPSHFFLSYHPVSDVGIFDPSVIEARAEKEQAAVAAWRLNSAPLRSMHALHAWLFATHLCYSVGRQDEFGREKDLDPRLAATY